MNSTHSSNQEAQCIVGRGAPAHNPIFFGRYITKDKMRKKKRSLSSYFSFFFLLSQCSKHLATK